MNRKAKDQVDRLVFALIDGQLSEEQKDELNRLLQESPEAVLRYRELLDNHESLCAIYPGDVYAESLQGEPTDPSASVEAHSSPKGRQFILSPKLQLALLVVAASLLVLVGLAGYRVGSDRNPALTRSQMPAVSNPEQTIAGHAMLQRSVELQWTAGSMSYRDGDVLPSGVLKIESGFAEIDFFCGATLVIEGPASLDVQSDWSVKINRGRVRASVPPAARGFMVQTDVGEVIDLGTEFALDVATGNARVEVIDGEVAIRGGAHDGVHLFTGQQQWLGEGGSASSQASRGRGEITSSADVGRKRDGVEVERFARWREFARDQQQDDRLIAYYKIADMPLGRTIPNAASSGDGRDAILVGPVQRSSGRFGQRSNGLAFDRIGARARTRIDGSFKAFTFVTWVRIDSLDQVYNALFMSDGYETGELHWQIRDDGALMFSVMVDDTQEVRHFSKRDGSMVSAAGLQTVYFSPPVWDLSKSGGWFHLAAVYDPVGRQVTQYVNGEQVSSERIQDKFYIQELKIGPAEIGNWGQPFRETPWFAVRNLNGTIDEMAIYNAALGQADIRNLYERGKPIGY